MLIQQTIEKLSALKLHGMVAALEEWRAGGSQSLDPADLLGILVDAERTSRDNRRLTRRLQEARFPVAATVEAIDYQHPRKLEKSKFVELTSCRWVALRENVIITGPTGVGKTYLACALGNRACRAGYRVICARAPRLFDELYKARVDGTLPRLLQRLAKANVLAIDDLGSSPLEAEHRRDLREVLEDRYSSSSTIITSQLAPKHWHSFIRDDTVADAISDRLVQDAHRLELDGESLRKAYGMNVPGAEATQE